jgi:hypothetical protein
MKHKIIIVLLFITRICFTQDVKYETYDFTINYQDTITWSPTIYGVNQFNSGDFLYVSEVPGVNINYIESVAIPVIKFTFDSCGQYRIIGETIISDDDLIFCMIHEIIVNVLPIEKSVYTTCDSNYQEYSNCVITNYICTQLEPVSKDDFYIPDIVNTSSINYDNSAVIIFNLKHNAHVVMVDRWGNILYNDIWTPDTRFVPPVAVDIITMGINYRNKIYKHHITITR